MFILKQQLFLSVIYTNGKKTLPDALLEYVAWISGSYGTQILSCSGGDALFPVGDVKSMKSMKNPRSTHHYIREAGNSPLKQHNASSRVFPLVPTHRSSSRWSLFLSRTCSLMG